MIRVKLVLVNIPVEIETENPVDLEAALISAFKASKTLSNLDDSKISNNTKLKGESEVQPHLNMNSAISNVHQDLKEEHHLKESTQSFVRSDISKLVQNVESMADVCEIILQHLGESEGFKSYPAKAIYEFAEANDVTMPTKAVDPIRIIRHSMRSDKKRRFGKSGDLWVLKTWPIYNAESSLL